MSIGFVGSDADDDAVVHAINQQLLGLKKSHQLKRGNLLRVKGSISVPGAITLASHIVPLYKAVAVYRPKRNCFMVAHATKFSGYAVGAKLPDW